MAVSKPTLTRRLRTIATFAGGLLLLLALTPVAVPVLAVLDAGRWLLRRRPWMGTRLYLFGLVYLAAEMAGLGALGAVWVAAGFGRRHARLIEWTFTVQQMWAGSLLFAARTIFGLRFEVTGSTEVSPGPILLMVRHASIVDNLLPSAFVSRPSGIRLRYVLKRELLSDPCLDVAGNRLPNYFVQRGSGEAEKELAEIRKLGRDLDERQGVLIYPEGTRFSAEKQRRALDRLSRSSPGIYERARRLRHVLPPRPAGTLALLESTAPADVVVLAHYGLDGFAHLRDIWAGGMVRATVRVHFRRIPRSRIPEGRAAQTAWLYEVWQAVDDWIGEASSSADL